MGLLADFVRRERDEILGRGIRLTTIGETARLPFLVRAPLEALMAESARNRDMTLCLALSYGGREAIVQAARRIAEARAPAGSIPPRSTRPRSRPASTPHRSAARPAGAHLGRAAPVELPPLGGRLRRASLHRGRVARLRPRRTDARHRAFERRERRFGLTSEQAKQAQRRAGTG